MKVTFKIGDSTYTGNTPKEIADNIHKKFDGTAHPFANYNILYNAILSSAKRVEKPLSQTPPNQTSSSSPIPKHSALRRKLTAQEAVNATSALIKMNFFGLTVDQKEATRRADICRGCDYLAHVSDCGTCSGARRRLAALAGKITGFFQKKLNLGHFKAKNASSPHTALKSYCGVCGCCLQTLLPVRVQDYKPAAFAKPEDRPEYCWLRKDSDNFIDT